MDKAVTLKKTNSYISAILAIGGLGIIAYGLTKAGVDPKTDEEHKMMKAFLVGAIFLSTGLGMWSVNKNVNQKI